MPKDSQNICDELKSTVVCCANSYPSDQNVLISKGIIYARQIFLKLKIAGEIVFGPIRLV